MDNYAWVNEMKNKIKTKAFTDPDVKRVMKPQPVSVPSFTQYIGDNYRAEYGAKDGDLIFHFFPNDIGSFSDKFEDEMGDAFVLTFKFRDKLQAAYSEELNSWAVRVIGYGDNQLAPNLALTVFKLLDIALK